MLNKAMFQNESDVWGTPQKLFDQLNSEFHFTLDVCANKNNAKCERFFTIDDDALVQDWSNDVCFMNPPYSRIQDDFVKKAKQTADNGGTVVCLLPARTDTRRFFNYIWDEQRNKPKEGVEVRFIKGRLKFEGQQCKNAAPFPSMIVIFYGLNE